MNEMDLSGRIRYLYKIFGKETFDSVNESVNE